MTPIIYKVTLDIKRNLFQTLVMKEGNKDSTFIEVTITDNGQKYNISGYDINLQWNKPDNTVVLLPLTSSNMEIIDNYTFRIKCSEQMLSVSGLATFDILLLDSVTSSVLYTMSSTASINPSAVPDDVIASADEFETLTDLLVSNLQVERNLENLNTEILATNTTINENEEIRKANEVNRQINEISRDTAEGIRNIAEEKRSSKEIDRETAEATRNMAEADRNTNEITRQNNEATRQNNEATRQNNEATRQEQETSRSDAELNRNVAEGARASNESNRISNENIREANERNRVSAEAMRETETITAVTQANNAAANANTATQEADIATDGAINAASEANTATQAANTVLEDMRALIANDNIIHKAQLGVANGVATLDANGNIPARQLPSFVDDVLDGTYDSTNKLFLDLEGNPYIPEGGKIYIDVNNRTTYRWSGTVYVPISSSLALGTTASTAFPGDRGLALETEMAEVQEYHNNLTATQIKFNNTNTSLLGANVQTALENLTQTVTADVNALKTHKTSNDHDGRYYTETEVNNLLNKKQNSDSAINTGNIANQSVNYANSAGNADTLDGYHEYSFLKTDASCNKNWNWSGGAEPTWLWGSNDGHNMYVCGFGTMLNNHIWMSSSSVNVTVSSSSSNTIGYWGSLDISGNAAFANAKNYPAWTMNIWKCCDTSNNNRLGIASLVGNSIKVNAKYSSTFTVGFTMIAWSF